ncbi:hypothetical protein SAMN06265222_101622 [Neorhodopirellula lusitana]|uniref:Uncharacterized protein n=1 Tax=Neorhodopirellula lusitana TaxID=445327 RepID=A0ABY1PR50_9BACT|nr:hypothetical protein SAMN06265222_101622 [Neorhodopirellula lusitana]
MWDIPVIPAISGVSPPRQDVVAEITGPPETPSSTFTDWPKTLKPLPAVSWALAGGDLVANLPPGKCHREQMPLTGSS